MALKYSAKDGTRINIRNVKIDWESWCLKYKICEKGDIYNEH